MAVSGAASHLEHYIARPTSLDNSVAASWASCVLGFRFRHRSGARPSAFGIVGFDGQQETQEDLSGWDQRLRLRCLLIDAGLCFDIERAFLHKPSD